MPEPPDPGPAREAEGDPGAPAVAKPEGAQGEPRRFAHFALRKQLGRGAQGVVFLAEDLQLHRMVALKMLSGAAAQSTGVRDRFRREAEITSKLNHPGICGVYELGESEGVPFIAMQYVRGTTLGSLVDASKASTILEGSPKGAPEGKGSAKAPGKGASVVLREGGNLQDVLLLIEGAARALHVAHEAGLVHRDIKPGNLMVTPEGAPVLLDFGLARDLGLEGHTLTQSGQILGTPAYLAAEQIRGGREQVDRRTDVYGLGVTLFECLTLHRPFDGETFDELFHAILEEDPPNPQRLNPRIPDDLKTVLETAMERDRARRYATALDFAEDLRRVRSFEPIRAKPAGPVLRLRKWSRRNPALAVALAAALVIVLGGGGLLLGQSIARKGAIREHLSHAESLLAEADFAGALESVARALERDPSWARVVGADALRARIERASEQADREARRGADLAAAAVARSESAARQEDLGRARSDLAAQRAAIEAGRPEVFAHYASLAARGAFARKERELAEREAEAARLLQEAQEALQRAARLEAPWGGTSAETEAAFAAFYFHQWTEATAARDAVRAAWLRAAVEAHDRAGRFTGELRGRGTLVVDVDPPSAEVFLFREEPYESVRDDEPVVPRLVPAPTTGIGWVEDGPWRDALLPGDLCQRIVSIEEGSLAAAAGLRAGDFVARVNGAPCGEGLFLVDPPEDLVARGVPPVDRIVSLNGMPVESAFDWATAPAGRATPEAPGDRLALASIPGEMPCDRAKLRRVTPQDLLGGPSVAPLQLLCVHDGAPVVLEVPPGARSGIRCEPTAAPLLCAPQNRIDAGRAIEADPGTYRLLVRGEGREDQVLSLVVPRNGEARARVALLPQGATPPGFVYVPAGPFVFHGDPQAFDPRAEEVRELPGFFIAVKEVTNREWFEFVNDPETLRAIEASASDEASRRLYLPRESSKRLVRLRPDGGYGWERGSAETPLYGVSWNDARAYVAWRNARAERAGEPWEFDLPSQEEWEKAARGADGRAFPWGDRFDFALMVGRHRKADWLLDVPGGFEPRDRSPYGVLDMAGSRRELTRDAVEEMDPPAFYTRGSFWGEPSEIAFRCASRAYTNAERTGGDMGFRLVARRRG